MFEIVFIEIILQKILPADFMCQSFCFERPGQINFDCSMASQYLLNFAIINLLFHDFVSCNCFINVVIARKLNNTSYKTYNPFSDTPLSYILQPLENLLVSF